MRVCVKVKETDTLNSLSCSPCCIETEFEFVLFVLLPYLHNFSESDAKIMQRVQ